MEVSDLMAGSHHTGVDLELLVWELPPAISLPIRSTIPGIGSSVQTATGKNPVTRED